MGFHEVIPAGEAELFEGFAAEMRELQRARALKSSAAPRRALHVKQHLGAVGVLEIKAEAAARSGLFERDARFPVYVRLSSGAGKFQSDKVGDVRGFALKLVGVPGKKLISGLEQEQTQDFLFIQDAAVPFRDPAEFMTFVRAAKDGSRKLLPRLFRGFGLHTFAILSRALKSAKVTSYALQDFHTAAPIAFGASAAKLALFPLQHASAAPMPAPTASQDSALRDDLLARLETGPLAWSLKAQLFRDDRTTPIEDTSVRWTGPFLELGRLTLPRQAPESPQGRRIAELVEQLSFDPWHALEAHRPLGAMMRARAATYRESVSGRQAAPEPKLVLEP